MSALGAVGAFLAGRPPRGNGHSPADRYAAAALAPLAHDAARVAAVRRVAARCGADTARYYSDAHATAAHAARLRAQAVALGEALAGEGLLPPEWADPDALRWAGWVPLSLRQGDRSVNFGAVTPHEVATLAAWAPAVEFSLEQHGAMVDAARAWGAVVGTGFTLITEPADAFDAPFDLDVFLDGSVVWGDALLRHPPAGAAEAAIEESPGAGGVPEWVAYPGAFAEDILELKFPDESGAHDPATPRHRRAPEFGSLLDRFLHALHAEAAVAEAARRGLVVGGPEAVRESANGIVKGDVAVSGLPFAEAPNPLPYLLAAYEAGVPVLEARDSGVVYLLRGLPGSPPRDLAGAPTDGAPSHR